jgi:hypothetical protein
MTALNICPVPPAMHPGPFCPFRGGRRHLLSTKTEFSRFFIGFIIHPSACATFLSGTGTADTSTIGGYLQTCGGYSKCEIADIILDQVEREIG